MSLTPSRQVVSRETSDVETHLNALTAMSSRLPSQERHEIESMATTRRQAGHLRWISPVQAGRLFDLWRKYVRGEA